MLKLSTLFEQVQVRDDGMVLWLWALIGMLKLNRCYFNELTAIAMLFFGKIITTISTICSLEQLLTKRYHGMKH